MSVFTSASPNFRFVFEESNVSFEDDNEAQLKVEVELKVHEEIYAKAVLHDAATDKVFTEELSKSFTPYETEKEKFKQIKMWCFASTYLCCRSIQTLFKNGVF